MQDQFQRTQWILLQQRNNFNILKHQQNGNLIEEYLIPSVSEEEKILWTKRLKIKHQNVLNVFGCELFYNLEEQNKQLCNFSMRVYIDATYKRFNEMENITEQSQQKWIIPILKGYAKLFQQYGGFSINESSISLSYKQQIKVWKSSNFLNNNINVNQISQKEMVNKILGIFKSQKLRFLNISTFNQAISFINVSKLNYIRLQTIYETSQIFEQNFLKYNRVTIDKIKPVKINNQKYQQKQNNYFQKIDHVKSLNIRYELFDSNRTIEQKLKLCKQYLKSNQTSSPAKLCIIFKYSYYKDKYLYQQLGRVKGRIIYISDLKILQKITQIVDKQKNFNCIEVQPLSENRNTLNKIKCFKNNIVVDYGVQIFPKSLNRQQRILQAKQIQIEAELLFN